MHYFKKDDGEYYSKSLGLNDIAKNMIRYGCI